jgi:hypothetical protein
LKSVFAFVVRYRWCVLTTVFAVSSTVTAQQVPPAPSETTPQGTVLFNRDENTTSEEKKPTVATPQSIETVSDVDRAALAFTAYDLDVHLVPAKSQVAVHIKVIVRNDGTTPLARLALQVSSSLKWESFAVRDADRIVPLSFVQHTIDTDADHTGKAQEAIVSLPQPLASGASVELTAFYAGTVEQSGERLMRIGAPAEQAAGADWDTVGPVRIALRGFGNVLWYPVAAAPVFLGDGAKLFQSAGRTKLLQASAKVRLRLAVSYVGDPPDTAYFCGRREKLIAVSENMNVVVAESPGVATAEFPEGPLGFRAMSLFVTDRAATMTDGDIISAVTDHYDALPGYATAASKVQPLLKSWLGADPLMTLDVIDQQGQPFEDDALLVTQMRAVEPIALAPALVHSLTHAWFRSSHVWLNEGVAQFMSLLWVEQTEGRDVALKHLQQEVNTLSLAEPEIDQNADHTVRVGQSLIGASDEVYYRTKAASVLWMLRSIVGEDALKQALQQYRQSEKGDIDPKQFQRVVERASKRDLGWFFEDWVYRDRGLPDLTIASVTPRKLPSKGVGDESWLIAIEVRNEGDAAAEVPVTVRSGSLTTTEKLRIMGRSTASTRIVFAGRPDEVVVNDGSVPEVTAATHSKTIEVQ